MLSKFGRFVCVFFLASAISYGQRIIHVPADQPTIQAGINAANTGDTVLVAPGTYAEHLDFLGKAITVTSAAGAASTIIDGGMPPYDPAVRFINGETRASVLNGFTVQNGGSGAAGVDGSGMPGGIYVSDAQPTISNNTITHDHCYGIESLNSSPLIQNNEIDNTLDENEGCGFAAGAAIWLSGSLNYYNGGTSSTSPPAVVFGNTIQNNTQSGKEDAGGNGGVGVAIWGANALIESNTIRHNATLSVAAIYAFNTDLVSIVGNLIYGNSAYGTAGVDVMPPEETAGPFIGIIADNTIFGNTVEGPENLIETYGSEVRLTGNLAQYLLVNNIIVGTTHGVPPLGCDTGYNYLSYTPLVFDHNDIYDATGGAAYGGACPDQTGTYGNISADPRFVSSAAGAFQLQPGSPAIDSGNNSAPKMLATDIAGAARIQDATGLGHPVTDMGAFEASGTGDAPVTTLMLSPSTYYPGASGPFTPAQGPFTLTAVLAAGGQVPSGPVTFYADMNPIGTVPVDSTGRATLQPALPPGLHAFLATYPGQGAFPAAVSVKFYVLFPKATPALTLASGPNPALLGAAVTFTIKVSSPDGSIPGPITLADATSGSTLTTLTPDSTGTATFSISTLTLGSHQIAASFAGNSSDDPASATLTQVVVGSNVTTTTLSSSLNPSIYSQPVTFTAHVTSAIASAGPPTGSVTFVDGNNMLAAITLNASGSASLTTSTLTSSPPQTPHLITAIYTPSGGFGPSSATLNQLVNGLASTTTLTVTPLSGASTDTYTMVATVANSSGIATSALPSGTVNFYFNGYGASAIYANLVNGVATSQATNLTPGQNVVNATYHGDTVFAPSSSNIVALTINGQPTTLTLTSSGSPAFALTPFTLTAHLTSNGAPVPAGSTIALNLGPGQSVNLLTDATGSASYKAIIPAPGSYPVTATFAGENALLASSATLTEVIQGVLTNTSLSATPNPAYQGQAITLTATVTASGSQLPTGPVTFYDGTTPLGTANLTTSAQAVFTTSSLASGTHTLTASYPTIGALVGSSSAAVQEKMLASSFAMNLSTPSITLKAGQQGTVAIGLTSLGAFAGPLALSYGTLPAYAAATVSPGTVTLIAGGTGSANLLINTAEASASTIPSRPGTKSWPLVLSAMLLLPLAAVRSRRLRQALGLVFTAVLFQALIGCATIREPFDFVASGNYQIPVTATDSNHNQQTATLTVVITP